MNKYTLSLIGEFHTNQNEDAYAIVDLGQEKMMIAVMDGCSMGKESHFASTLISKLLRKIGKELGFRNFAERNQKETSEYLREILEKLFDDLKHLKSILHLEKDELLSTLILGVLDKSSLDVEIITVGDGLICSNGELIEYEQNDKPDYLGYHLDGEFNPWFQNQSQVVSLKNVKDLSISTDGIFTFKNFDGKPYPEISEEELVQYLLIDEEGAEQENMLKKKILTIENKYGQKPSDDLTIIRIKSE